MRSSILAPRFTVFALMAAVACSNLKDGSIEPEGGVDATSDGIDGAVVSDAKVEADASSDGTFNGEEGGADTSSSDATTHQEEGGAEPEESGSTPDVLDASQDSLTDAGSDADATALGNPTAVAPSHLRLWLAADFGLTCAPVDDADGGDGSAVARVTSWSDRSGHHDDATLQQLPRQLGPQCHVAGHAVNGVDLPYFSAPNNGNVVDETLDVDLSFLKGSDYTIFVVERRWADYGIDASTASEFVVGTSFPAAVESGGLSNWCNPRPANEVLFVGYSYYNGMPDLILAQGCGLIGGIVDPVTTLPGPLSEETARLDQAAGRELWVKGSPFATDVNSTPLSYASGGAIGRAASTTTALGFDDRFRGDIAEVIVYDSALSDEDRTAVERYLSGHWHY